MAELLTLPDELLLNIAHHVRYSDRNFRRGYKILKQLALTCRQLRPIAQEALHCDVMILRSQVHLGYSDTVGKFLLGSLVRTLLERPDLAAKVRNLRLIIMKENSGHGLRCARLGCCICGWLETAEVCEGFLRTAQTMNGLKLYNDSWLGLLVDGWEPALAGVVLACTPTLTTLALSPYDAAYLDDGRDHMRSNIDLHDLFGTLVKQDNFTLDAVPGLAKVTKLSSVGLLPPAMMELPKLRALKFGLQNDQYDRYDTIPKSILLPRNPGDLVLSTTLKQLDITLDVNATFAISALDEDNIFSYFGKVMRGINNLTHLFLQFGKKWEPEFIQFSLSECSYANVVSRLESDSLESLTIDACDIERNYDVEESYEVYQNNVRPITTIFRLPKLRSLTAPQEAFFSVDDLFEICALPISVERIGIIDSTSALKRYIKHLLENKAKVPKLKAMRLWLGEGTEHLGPDYRLEEDIDFDANTEVTDEEWKMQFEVDDMIWEQAKRDGIHVKKMAQPKGWRKGRAAAQ